jgi:alkylated DNA repair dioxygenase AlkB
LHERLFANLDRVATTVHQPTLLGASDPAIDPDAVWARIELDATAWVDVAREWLAGADALLARLVDAVPWKQGRRKMWDRVLDDPRLSHWGHRGDPPLDPALTAVHRALERRYHHRLHGPALNYYRDGRDSVAWHADRELRDLDDTLVGIVTLGTRRPFLLRPKGGGPSIDLAPGSGDVLVMGGSAQRDWEHTVPKTVRPGPRISVSFRWSAGPETRRAHP